MVSLSQMVREEGLAWVKRQGGGSDSGLGSTIQMASFSR